MPPKPRLSLLDGQDSFDVNELARLFERLTGRTPSKQELDEARAGMAQAHELPDAHFGGAAAPLPARVDDGEGLGDDDDDELDETPADVIAMLGFDPAELAETKTANDRMAFDRASVRTIDQDGRMHVEITHISKANVCPYRGIEIINGATDIVGTSQDDIDPDRTYYLLRDPEELAKAASTFNNLPLLSKHVAVTVDKPEKELIIGSTGTDATFEHPYLDNSLVVWTAEAIDGVETGEQQEISCAYRYVADMTPGTFEGIPYDGVMREIRGNHVALVAAGRAGPDVIVGDSITTESTIMQSKSLSKKAVLARGALLAFLAPRIAADQMPDLKVILTGVKRKNWLDKKPGIIAAIKPALAQDADLDGIVELLDRLDGEENNDDDVAVDSPFENVLEKLRGKISDEDLAEVTSMLNAHGAATPAAATDETPEQKEAREKKEAEEKLAKDTPTKTEGTPDAPYKDKAAMDQAIASAVDKAKREGKIATDAAIKAATEQATKDALQRARQISAAEDAIKPQVGKLNIAFDSAESVYKAALEAMGIKIEGVHPSAYKSVFEAQPRAGAAAPRLVHDSAQVDDEFGKQFPDALRLKSA